MTPSPAVLRELAREGLWSRNPGLVALLGLCPLLAVSTTLINGLALGLATTATLVLSNGLVSALRGSVLPAIRLPLFVLLMAAIVTAVDLVMQAGFPELHRTLGLFIPLIVTNCAILARIETYASRQPVTHAVLDGLFMGLGFLLVIALLGGLRELLGTGRLLAGAEQLFGPGAAGWTVEVISGYGGFLLALLPPGAFFGLGLMLALKNRLDAARQATTPRARVRLVEAPFPADREQP